MKQSDKPATRIFFIEMMGIPGSYDASVYDDFEDKDQEGLWFIKNYRHIPDITIATRNVCTGEELPRPEEIDGLVLAGSYHSVHDNTCWQQRVLSWLPNIRANKVPLLGICGSHQLLAHYYGAKIEKLIDGPYAGTFPTSVTHSSNRDPIFDLIESPGRFHYANSEHVVNIPSNATLLAASGRVPIAALAYGDDWYSTQFHPEATAKTLSTVWKYTQPSWCDNYDDNDDGKCLVENFLKLVVNRTQSSVTDRCNVALSGESHHT